MLTVILDLVAYYGHGMKYVMIFTNLSKF